MSLRITDELIYDVLRYLGPSTSTQIYREIIRRDSTLALDRVRKSARDRIRSCLKYRTILETQVENFVVYHLPEQEPSVNVQLQNKNDLILYLESLPLGAKVTYRELAHFSMCRQTVRIALDKTGFTVKYRHCRHAVFVKGA